MQCAAFLSLHPLRVKSPLRVQHTQVSVLSRFHSDHHVIDIASAIFPKCKCQWKCKQKVTFFFVIPVRLGIDRWFFISGDLIGQKCAGSSPKSKLSRTRAGPVVSKHVFSQRTSFTNSGQMAMPFIFLFFTNQNKIIALTRPLNLFTIKLTMGRIVLWVMCSNPS